MLDMEGRRLNFPYDAAGGVGFASVGASAVGLPFSATLPPSVKYLSISSSSSSSVGSPMTSDTACARTIGSDGDGGAS
eukprot:SAG11_NODE_7253_length_1172_cov_1.729730_2_plen_78_part_00